MPRAAQILLAIAAAVTIIELLHGTARAVAIIAAFALILWLVP